MLTTKEIKKELDAGREVELECIDTEGFLGKESNTYLGWKKVILSLDRIIATSRSYNDDASMLKDARGTCITDSQLKYFRIKRPAPTFDDLIDVAVKAVKDKLIIINAITDWQIQFVRGSDTRYVVSHDHSRISEEIDFINSLYTETFVIEHASDIKNIKKTAIIRLENDNEVCAESNCLHNGVNFIQTTYGGMNFNLSFVSLKGATVTQKRGEV